MREERQAWVLLQKAEDLPDVWVAHCLEYDIMSQGDSIDHAMASLIDAVQVSFDDDREHGLDPLERQGAPDDAWDAFKRVMTSKTRCTLSSLKPEERARVKLVVSSFVIEITYPESVKSAVDCRVKVPPANEITPAWQISALAQLRGSGPVSRPC